MSRTGKPARQLNTKAQHQSKKNGENDGKEHLLLGWGRRGLRGQTRGKKDNLKMWQLFTLCFSAIWKKKTENGKKKETKIPRRCHKQKAKGVPVKKSRARQKI